MLLIPVLLWLSKMGYLQDARENHVKKKAEEALRSKMKQKALRECDHYASSTNDDMLEEMKQQEYALQQNGKP
ncbi:hypothetical protein SDJN03_07810, partial [Cucurbita argyrosperma subsp. sororia]